MSGEQEASAALKPPRPLGSPRSFTLPARLYFVSIVGVIHTIPIVASTLFDLNLAYRRTVGTQIGN
jgi:hypothetical protein